jgi:predicted sulfurtransferase
LEPILNISAYLFTPLADCAALRDSIRSQAGERGLKGTVLLAEEGLNLFLAGEAAPLREFVAGCAATPASPGSTRRKAGPASGRSASCWSRSSARSSA